MSWWSLDEFAIDLDIVKHAPSSSIFSSSSSSSVRPVDIDRIEDYPLPSIYNQYKMNTIDCSIVQGDNVQHSLSKGEHRLNEQFSSPNDKAYVQPLPMYYDHISPFISSSMASCDQQYSTVIKCDTYQENIFQHPKHQLYFNSKRCLPPSIILRNEQQRQPKSKSQQQQQQQQQQYRVCSQLHRDSQSLYQSLWTISLRMFLLVILLASCSFSSTSSATPLSNISSPFSPSLEVNQSNTKRLLIKIMPNGGRYYERPSDFFNRYFLCRFNFYNSTNTFIKSNVDGNDQELDESAEKDISNISNKLFNGSNIRHSHHSVGNRRGQAKALTTAAATVAMAGNNCPIDCDGVLMWPETKANTVHYLTCNDVFQTVRRYSLKMYEEADSSNDGNGEEIKMSKDSIELSHDGRPTLLHYFRMDGDGPFMASRKCLSDGSWEMKANYTACGLDTDRLFVLNQQQMEKIFEIRMNVVLSNFTKNIKTDEAFIKCVDTILSLPPSQLPEPFCERTFDGWTCFNDTPANFVQYFKCPEFIYGFNPQNEAHKTCTTEGKWREHPMIQKPWTNYTSCVDIPDLNFRRVIMEIHIAGYSISLAALLISIGIFFSFKTLSTQTRIRIHKNFFISFIVNNSMWIVWYSIINDHNILLENGLACQSLHVLLQYFLVCNYFWMFCEGLYLHTILVVAFVSEGKILKWFYLIGWALPAIFVIPYAILRASSPDSHNCWIDESKYAWIFNVPVCIVFVLNIIFLVNIVRVLVTKLKAVNNSADSHQTRKAVRATLILMPLLGLHFILTPFRPETEDQAMQIYEMFSAVVSSLQGFCVAMLFCFFNGEVLAELKKRWNQFLLMHGYGSSRRMSYGNTTVSINLSNCNLTIHNDNNNPNEVRKLENNFIKTKLNNQTNGSTISPVHDNNNQNKSIISANDNNGSTKLLHYEHLTSEHK